MKTSSKKSKRRGGHMTVCAACPTLTQRPNHGVHRYSVRTRTQLRAWVSFCHSLSWKMAVMWPVSINHFWELNLNKPPNDFSHFSPGSYDSSYICMCLTNAQRILIAVFSVFVGFCYRISPGLLCTFFYPICCKCNRLFPLKAFSVSLLYYSILYIRVNEGYQDRPEDWGSLDER